MPDEAGESSRDVGVEFESEELTEAFHRYDELWRHTPVPRDRLAALGIPAEDFARLLNGQVRMFTKAGGGALGLGHVLLAALGTGIKLGEARALRASSGEGQ
jgi:hypothetical protein